jgi:acetyl esterase/lipase
VKVIKDIPYAPQHGERGLLDLMLPDGAADRPVVVVIHGGGFQALNKERMTRVGAFLVERAFAVVNINYRLLPECAFPAPVEDGLAACRWVKETDQPDLVRQRRDRIALLGGSAGAYLALAVGLMLGPDEVASIVSISGPVRRRKGADDGSPLCTPPIELVSRKAPPVLATHSRNDKLVTPDHSIEIVGKLRSVGARAELYLYDGPGELHGIWRDEDEDPPRLFGHIEERIAAFLSDLF